MSDATPTEAHPEAKLLRLTLNGRSWLGAVEQHALLLDVIRYQAGLTGTKRGCDMGTCGCCAVQINGEPRLSCLTLAHDCEGAEIRTIEGVQSGPLLSALQDAWVATGASQCGFCSPGFIMVGEALLEEKPKPTEREVREAIAGNLCRCTGYVKIVEAFMVASGQAEPGQDAVRRNAKGDSESD
ncbi:MAG: (2Fe-2S)-binding protein [Rickettsiales bacterium]|nr:(2Fe-2S)-binding protein [Rickettsiales bacterium]